MTSSGAAANNSNVPNFAFVFLAFRTELGSCRIAAWSQCRNVASNTVQGLAWSPWDTGCLHLEANEDF